MTSNSEIPNLKAPSDRLKYLRGLIRVSRAYLQDKYGVPEVTLKSWENGTTKVSSAGAKRCIEVYHNEGIVVSEDWILEGAGLPPKSAHTIGRYFAVPSELGLTTEDDEFTMIKDANSFKESHQNSVVMMVSNDDMRPYYKPGDYIGGRLRSGEDIVSAVNRDCIIYTESGDRYFRRLLLTSAGKYNLTSLNPSMETGEPVIYDVRLSAVAPVIWHRWKDVR